METPGSSQQSSGFYLIQKKHGEMKDELRVSHESIYGKAANL
jgi:hypothetical protein